ncbi:protein translocase subunit [Tulasnella sp. 403]|nr:protein translocase subunit [Tulasnella sp. 403]
MDFLKSSSSPASDPGWYPLSFLARGKSIYDLKPDITAKKELVKEQIRREIAVANAQELVSKIHTNCFEKCVTKPSGSLSSSEETCLSRCMERYMEAFNIVSKTYVDRLAKERAAAQQSPSL